MSTWGQISFQDAASPSMHLLILLHDHAMMIITLVITVVACAILSLLQKKFTSRVLLEAQTVETIWTILPALILITLAIPSLRLLYLADEMTSPALTVKATGHQWYWTYEYSDLSSPLKFDSYMVPSNELLSGEFRLLEVDNRAVFPTNTETRLLVTGADVIHSWAVPSMGLKVDAIPGRLNQVSLYSPLPGVYYGQCSEICGANHSFMPIAIELISPPSFNSWLTSHSQDQTMAASALSPLAEGPTLSLCSEKPPTNRSIIAKILEKNDGKPIDACQLLCHPDIPKSPKMEDLCASICPPKGSARYKALFRGL